MATSVPGDDEESLSVVPANEASWEDLQLVFGTRGDPATCQCQWFKTTSADWKSIPVEQQRRRLREQTGCDNPTATSTIGLVAYLEGEAVGWVSVEPRTEFLTRLATSRVPWAGRDEDQQDAGVWAVMCFVVRKGFRRRGIARALARASVGYARDHGARAIEGYPMTVDKDQTVSWGQLYIGSVGMFESAGFDVVASPTEKRRVMRINF
jgi:GNAT superfamily N-acetyltransferase